MPSRSTEIKHYIIRRSLDPAHFPIQRHCRFVGSVGDYKHAMRILLLSNRFCKLNHLRRTALLPVLLVHIDFVDIDHVFVDVDTPQRIRQNETRNFITFQTDN